MKRLIAIILLFAAWPAIAADLNGYTAQYECRAGNSNCNVDVATLTAQACHQTIAVGDAWSTINWSNNVICLANGDHTAKGTLALGSSGTSGTRKVLRYYRASDNDDEPWNMSDANKAKIYRIDSDNKAYWIIHRLNMQGGSVFGSPVLQQEQVYIHNGSNNIILNRMYFTKFTADGSLGMVFIKDTTTQYIWVQNSVFWDPPPNGVGVGTDNWGVYIEGGTFHRIVNNEMRNNTGAFLPNITAGYQTDGSVFENNDAYVTSAYYTDCTGTFNVVGKCSATRGGMDFKSCGTAANPVKVIHNRIWGQRVTDINVAATSTSSGSGGTWSTDLPETNRQCDYHIYQNNIIMNTQYGFLTTRTNPNNNSAVGNLIYDIQDFNQNTTPITAGESAGLSIYYGNQTEYYLNTIIGAKGKWAIFGGVIDLDLRCNVIIDSGAKSGTPGTGSVVDYNTYYGTPDSGEANKLGNYVLNTRANSTAYSLGAIIRTTATPPANGTAGDFLYKVTTAGISAGSTPTYTTTLGGTTTDGTMVVTAIRGPYSFYRKLRTSAELTYIPYARAHSSAPESLFCPSTYAGRTGIGIGDE